MNPEELLVKRVVAVPGDRIHLQGGKLFRNGKSADEPFAIYSPSDFSPFRDDFPNLQRADPGAEAAWWIELRRTMRNSELPVPAGRLFAMGDNRNNSSDSRFWGFVSPAEVVGEPLLVYLSVNRNAPPKERIRWQRVGTVLH